MGISDLIEKGGIKVTELTVPSGGERSIQQFNAENEISDKEWSLMLTDLDTMKKDSSPASYISRIHEMRLLFPVRSKELCIDTETYQKYVQEIHQYCSEERWTDVILALGMFSEESFNRETDITLADKEKCLAFIHTSMDEHKNKGEWYEYFNLYTNAVFAFPDARGQFDAPENIYSQGKKFVQEKFQEYPTSSDATGVTAILMLLFPEHKADLPVSKQLWDHLYEQMQLKRRISDWYGFVSIALLMTIFSSERARLTDEGKIEIVPKQPDYTDGRFPIPVRRGF